MFINFEGFVPPLRTLLEPLRLLKRANLVLKNQDNFHQESIG